MIRWPLVVAMVVLPTTAWSGILLKTFQDHRFGTLVEFPADWMTGEPPADAPSYSLKSPDGKATITVSRGPVSFAAIAYAFGVNDKPVSGETISDRHLEKDEIVVSGKRGSVIFYRRGVLSCGNQVWTTISMEFPTAQRKSLDKVANDVVRSLRPSPEDATICGR